MKNYGLSLREQAAATLELRHREKVKAGLETFEQYKWYGEGGKARPSQHPPQGDWYIWMAMAGRGFGKTRLGAEWVRDRVENHEARYIALVGRTSADVRKVMVEGRSGILAVSRPDFRPIYEPSKRLLTWPNGAIATTYSAEEPNLLRGPEHDTAWSDEVGAWEANATETWDNLMMGLRVSDNPQAVVTTTPKSTKLVRQILSMSGVAISRGHTDENIANLSKRFIDTVIAPYRGTRLGRQELAGELLEDIEGALWTYAMFDTHRVFEAVPLERIVVAVDPSGGDQDGNSEQGIIVAGRSRERQGYVLGDYSCRLSPDGWGRRAVQAYLDHEADEIIVETNFGGDMALETIRTAAQAMHREGHPTAGISIKKITASRGKTARAQPVAALYEQGRVHHVGSKLFPLLETQCATWTPDQASPDRMDALVWALTDLLVGHVERVGRPVSGRPSLAYVPR